MKTNWPALRHGYLILAGMALASSPVLAQTQARVGATATAAVISSVAITQAPQRAAVRVEGEGRLDVHAGRMQNPDRLVLDFAGARVAVEKTVIPGISAPVRGVRIGQYRPDVARVVVDLTTASRFQISRDGDAVAARLVGRERDRRVQRHRKRRRAGRAGLRVLEDAAQAVGGAVVGIVRRDQPLVTSRPKL